MRVLLLSNGLPPTALAGTEHYTEGLARELARAYQVYVFCREARPCAREYTFYDHPQDGFFVRRVVNNLWDASDLSQHYRNPTIERLFQDFLDRVCPDIVHVQHCLGLSGGLPRLAQQRGIPVVTSINDYWHLCPLVQLVRPNDQACPGPGDGAACAACVRATLGPTMWLKRLPGARRLRPLVPHPFRRALLKLVGRCYPYHPTQPLDPTFVRLRLLYLRESLLLSRRVLVPSAFVREVYVRHGIPEAKLVVLPEGIDVEPWRQAAPGPPQQRPFSFGYLGTLRRAKGIHVLLAAYRALAAADTQLLIYGHGDPDDPYPRQLRGMARQDRSVHFRGGYQRSQLPQILTGLDTVVIPSLWPETFCLVAREALFAGVPVVASRIGALAEVVHPGENGELVPPGDAQELAAAMRCLRKTRERYRGHIGRSGIKTMAEHAQEVAHLYRQVLAEVQAERPSPGPYAASQSSQGAP